MPSTSQILLSFFSKKEEKCPQELAENLVLQGNPKGLEEYLNGETISSMLSTIDDCNGRDRNSSSAFANKICYMFV